MATPRKDHLIDVALGLFSREGFHATGIDRVLSVAGVAKQTLYKHFRSKEELILACLRRADERLRDDMLRAVGDAADTPRGQLLAIFDVLAAWISAPQWSGCPFLCAAAEYGDPRHPIHGVAAEHKRSELEWITDLVRRSGIERPDEVAAELQLLIEGVLARAQAGGGRRDAQVGRRAAARLLGG